MLDAFLDAVYDQHVEQEQSDLRVVYTPLNGTGLECVTRILERIGVTDVHVVEEQSKPDAISRRALILILRFVKLWSAVLHCVSKFTPICFLRPIPMQTVLALR